ncbi:precorrin-3B synthase [Streptomyces sp. NPDC012616]|uniref:precorrin-3B synthase n=1 Tax=Streptomyces sp. NPDC012616 TaxID=3364840 RepID=UPI0036E610E5
MLAAMSSADLRPTSLATAVSRDRGDACPGALRLHAADDGALARIRVPGGVLSVRQAEALGAAAGRLGDGELHLTSRGNVQLRGLADDCGAELAAVLDAAGLLPSPGHERVRNVVASPLSGLDGRSLRDVRPWVPDLDAALCASGPARELSGRFLFALDDGRGDVAGLGADVALRATDDGGAVLDPGAVRVSARDAPRAALLAAETFLEAVRESGCKVWRVAELTLPEGVLAERVRHRLAAEGIGRSPLTEVAPVPVAEGPAPGVVGDALSAHVPLGRLSAAQWRELTRVAGTELRLTPWRGVVVPVPGLGARQRAESLARLAAAGLVTDPASPWPRVGACVGRPGCGKSHADVRADAADTVDAAGACALPLYWSGCERRCGHPHGDRIDVVASADGGYRLAAVRAGRPTRTAPMTDPDDLAAALAAITS